jgi:SAM-dependent methyltransferase
MRCSLLAALALAGCAHAPPSCPAPRAVGHGWSAGLMHGEAYPPCDPADYHHRAPHDDFAATVARLEDPAREAWQKPAALLAALAPQGKVVADLGAGTGYFTVRLLETARKVLATDVDERMLAYVRGRVSTMAPPLREKLVLRLVGPERPGLVPEEADLALAIDLYPHVEERADWLRALAAGLRPNGEVVIVDWKAGDFPDAPPAEERVSATTVIEELKAAGFTDARLDEALLPRQFIVRARVAPTP